MELLITMTVGGILLAIAAPSFRNYVQNTKLTSQADALIYSLNLARDEAVKEDTTIDVCASSDGATCNGTSWAQGWIVLCPGPCPAGVGAAALQVSPAVSTGNTVAEEIAGATTVSYSSAGQTGAQFQFVFCDNRGPTFAQDIEVNQIGRIEAGASAGETVNGAALATCTFP